MNRKEITDKFKKIEIATKTLKTEFVGIDVVIDTIMENVRGWYVFPELQTKPITICLWGLTGCGKTSLVNRICELLDLKHDMVMYNLAKLGEESSEEIEDRILNQMGNAKSNRVFVLDEFQFAAAIDSKGNEKEANTALKTIWELIDTGKFHRIFGTYHKNKISNALAQIKYVVELGAEIKDGVFLNSKAIFDKMPLDKKIEFAQSFNSNESLGEYDDYSPRKYWCDSSDITISNNKDFWLTCEITGVLYETSYASGLHEYNETDYLSFLSKMSVESLIKYIRELGKIVRSGYDVDYSKSLVFVMGNIDEAYEMSYNIDPDMDPDQFRIRTERMTLVDIKEALGVRFRQEQIARLGNIMILYPSFSKQNFEDIIKLSLNEYSKSVKKQFGIVIEYDTSVNDIIYKDGVFPTHGTRPIFSSVYEIIQTKLPSIIMKAYLESKKSIEKVCFKYVNGEIVADITYKNGKYDIMQFKQPLRLEDKRKNKSDENQAITALHESGHFVMYAKLNGKLPAKIVSNAVSKNAAGFMQEDDSDDINFMTIEDCINEISVCLGGYVAEYMIFGKNVTTGASSDLLHATELASRMVRRCGLGVNCADSPFVTTYLTDDFGTHNGLLMHTDNNSDVNKKIEAIIRKAQKNVEDTFNDTDWYKMLIKSAEWLSCNIAMPKTVMEEIYALVPEEKRKENVRSECYFRDILKNEIAKLN